MILPLKFLRWCVVWTSWNRIFLQWQVSLVLTHNFVQPLPNHRFIKNWALHFLFLQNAKFLRIFISSPSFFTILSQQETTQAIIHLFFTATWCFTVAHIKYFFPFLDSCFHAQKMFGEHVKLKHEGRKREWKVFPFKKQFLHPLHILKIIFAEN